MGAQADNPLLTAITTHRIEEALRTPPFTSVRLAVNSRRSHLCHVDARGRARSVSQRVGALERHPTYNGAS